MTAPWHDDGVGAAAPTGSFGRYRIAHGLGVGGMGVVVAAFDPDLGRMVAIKFLQRAEPVAQARLVAEARAMARLSHPNVVAVHEVLRVGDRAGIVMELVEGSDLGGWLAAAPRSWPAIVDAYAQAARGLAAAHRAGLVHRDFKPANALIDGAGVVRVTDFGLARTLDDDGPSRGGTPGYMAPEQRRGEPVDDRTDQWALAFALQRALASDRRAGPPAPAHVLQALRRATAEAPADRFAGLDDLLAALAPRRRRGLVVAAAVGAIAVATGGALLAAPRDAAAPPSCAQVADATVATTWNPAVRAARQAAFDAAGGVAAATWARTGAALDGYAQAWRSARVEACAADRAATITPALSELRRACLDRRLVELDALVSALRAPSLETASRAHASALTLDDPRRCLDLEDLTRREPLPDDAARRPAVATARARLAVAHATTEVGRLVDARRQLTELLAVARAEAWPALTAEVLLEAGLAAAADRDFTAAALALDEGVLIAEAVGYDRATVRGLIALVDVRGRGLVEPAAALALVPRATAVLTRLGGDPALASALELARGRVLLVQGKYDDAFAVLAAALAALRARDPRHPDVATCEIDVGDALQKRGEPAAAIGHYRVARALREELFGRQHVLVARATYSVGNGLLELHDYPGALAAYQEALVAYEAIYGDRHPVLAGPLNNLGYAQILAGQPAAALPLLARGLAVASAGDHEPITLALLEGNIGDALRRLGRFAEARPYLERSLAGFRATYGADNPQVISALVDLAALELDRGDRAAAVAHLTEADRLSAALGPDHPLAVDVHARQAAAARLAAPRSRTVAGPRRP
ncbi:MAG: serine/threonine-protein kinase [Kofleriaceae bacterium]